MPIPITCSTCGARMRAPDNTSGRKTKCPKCGAALTVPETVVDAPESCSKPVAASHLKTRPASDAQRTVATPGALLPAPQPFEFDQQTAVPHSQLPPVVVYPPSGAAHSLGIASLVIGVLSFFVCWIPLLGMVVSGLGLALGMGGLILAIARRGSGVGFAIAGSGLSLVTLLICLLWTTAIGSAFSTMDKALNRQTKTNQTPIDAKNDVHAAGPEKKVDQEWPDATTSAVEQDNIQVRVVGVTIDFVQGKSFGDFKSQEKLLKIELVIENKHTNRKISFEGWGSSSTFLADDAPHVSDNFGNAYKRISFGLGSRIDGQASSESIYPGKQAKDLLVFEAPVENVDYLRLELPATNFGGTGKLRLQIPKTMIHR